MLVPPDASLVVRILGPVEISGSAGAVPLERPLERALAVRLALAGGQSVLDDTLVQALWGDADLTRPAERLRVVVSRLRASLGADAAALRRVSGGYALAAAVPDLEAAERGARTVHAAAAAGDTATIRTAAADALALWRGPTLADLRAVPFAAAEGDRLDGLRLQVQIERFAAEVDAGAHAAVEVELEQLSRDHPLNERLCRLLAVALYRAGRQAEALDRLARLRAALVDELGVDPAPETAGLEVQLLRQDPALAAPTGPKPLATVQLPTSVTAFTGRESEHAALVDQLAAPCLITLTGPPGTGKTRLAVEVARTLQGEGRPILWLDASPLHDRPAVLSALTAACDVDAGTADPLPTVAAALGAAVLVVDNAEHVVETIAEIVSDLRRRATRLSVLVTSQRPLLIAGEEVHAVGPLTPTAAAALFTARSGAPRDDDVNTICAAVDHLPLAVELAAGLTRTLTVRQLAQRIGDRLQLLVGGSRDAGGRHTSLRAALDWSFRLLDEPGRTALRRLAVFAGGCTLEAAEAVIGDDATLPLAAVPAAVADLADRCLVSVTYRGSAPRFRLLESVRDYALTQLRADPAEEGAVRLRHLQWCADYVRAHDVNVRGTDETGALESVFAEWPNLLDALDSAVDSPRAGAGLQLAVALDDAWVFRGMFGEARRQYARLIDAPGVADGERARALSNYAYAMTIGGDPDTAAGLLARADRLAEEAGDPKLRMRILYHRGILQIESGRPPAALAPLEDGQRIAAGLADERAVAAFADTRATAQLFMGQAVEAAAVHHELNELERAANHAHGLVRGLVSEAQALLASGEVDAALRCAAEGMERATDLGDAIAEGNLHGINGRAALMTGRLDESIDRLRTAIATLGPDEADSHVFRVDLAAALLQAADAEGARRELTDALAAAPHGGIGWLLAQPTVAALALADGDAARAQVLVDQAAAEYAERGFGWAPATARLAAVRAQLPSSAAALG